MSITPTGDRSGALATLGIASGPEAGSEIPIRSPVIRIGSGSRNDVVISDDSVSANHARLEFENDAWQLTDLRSTNGTFIDTVRLAPEVPTPLPYGSSIRLGAVPFQFHAVEAADPAAARAEYEPEPATERFVDRRSGFRLPVWLVVLVLLLIAAAVVFFGWIWTPTPEPIPPTSVMSLSPVLTLSP